MPPHFFGLTPKISSCIYVCVRFQKAANVIKRYFDLSVIFFPGIEADLGIGSQKGRLHRSQVWVRRNVIR